MTNKIPKAPKNNDKISKPEPFTVILAQIIIALLRTKVHPAIKNFISVYKLLSPFFHL